MENGFTLIEMLTVLAIIFTLTSISFPIYRITQQEYILENAAQKLAQDIRRVQEMAISTRICEICSPKKVPPGYGVYLQENSFSYIIYADTNPEQGNEFYDDADTIIEIVPLDNRIFIKSLVPSPLSINFRPPDPLVRIGNSSQTLNEGSITISLSNDTSKTKMIKINRAGLIYGE